MRSYRNYLIESLRYFPNNIKFPLSNESNKINVLEELHYATVKYNKINEVKQSHPYLFQYAPILLENSIGALLPLSWEIISFYLVYKEMEENYKKSHFLNGFMAFITSSPTYFLEYLFAKNLISFIYNFILENCYDIYSSNQAFISNPRSIISLLLLSMFLVSFSYTARAKVASDLFEGSPMETFILPSVIIGTIVFKISAITSNVIDIQNAYMEKYSDNSSNYKRTILHGLFKPSLRTMPPKSIYSIKNSLLFYSSSEKSANEQPKDNNISDKDSLLINNSFEA